MLRLKSAALALLALAMLAVFGGDSVSGLVTDATEIECDDDASASHEGNSGPGGGDDHGDDDPGDDDPGDDDPGDDEDCGTEALTAGREGEEAELKLSDGTATFREIELD